MLYLASDLSTHITGQGVQINGGFHVGPPQQLSQPAYWHASNHAQLTMRAGRLPYRKEISA